MDEGARDRQMGNEGMNAGIDTKESSMNTRAIIDRIFKDPATKYELTEFENLGKAIQDILALAIYPKTAATGRDAGKTKYYLKSLIPFSSGNEEVQIYVEDGKTNPEEIVRQLWVYKLIFAKIWDEKEALENRKVKTVEFGKVTTKRIIKGEEKLVVDADLTFDRINGLFKKACEEWPGTIGRTAPYLIDSHQAIPDNHVTILRSAMLDPAYLSFYLNSQAGKLQVEKYRRGSSGQLELYPFDIRKFQVWEAPQPIQQEIQRLYEQATESAKQSRELLDQAKSRVEQLIEEAARA